MKSNLARHRSGLGGNKMDEIVIGAYRKTKSGHLKYLGSKKRQKKPAIQAGGKEIKGDFRGRFILEEAEETGHR